MLSFLRRFTLDFKILALLWLSCVSAIRPDTAAFINAINPYVRRGLQCDHYLTPGLVWVIEHGCGRPPKDGPPDNIMKDREINWQKLNLDPPKPQDKVCPDKYECTGAIKDIHRECKTTPMKWYPGIGCRPPSYKPNYDLEKLFGKYADHRLYFGTGYKMPENRDQSKWYPPGVAAEASIADADSDFVTGTMLGPH